MIRRSIAMPSNRYYEDSGKAIICASHWENENPLGHLFVSNNSPDKRKHEWNCVVETPPCSMLENLWRAFSGALGDFVLIMGDDDRIFSLDTRRLEIANDIIGIQPHIAAYTTENGIIRVDASPITEETPLGRIQQFGRISQGLNLGFFTFWRRDILADMLDLWCNHHPTRGAYADWAFMIGMASSGKTVFDPSTIYFKNIDNWYGDQKKIDKEAKKLYRHAGLPEEHSQYDPTFKAIDSFIFVNRKNSPIEKDQKIQAAMNCLSGITFEQITETLDRCELLEKYKTFYEYATGYAYGTF